MFLIYVTRALPGNDRRNVQFEAVEHVRVQAEIDRMYAEGRLPEPASVDFIHWLHHEWSS